MVTLTIDGIQVTVPPGTMIVEAARRAGIKIPTLCYNKRLMPFGACRICVVQQKGRRGLIPACFNPVRNGMEILTNTPEVIKARRTQLQLILITHPLECPVCDAGGQCELQNLVYEYGVADNPFTGEKAKEPVDHVSPFIERNVNRCILCGMCVRIDDEVVGANELSFMNRGFKTKIGTDFDRPMNCEFCGQCVSVCPVGALNDRIFLHKARVWDLKETATTCGYCSVGCSFALGARGDRLLRARADENLGTNQGNLCVKGRFGWEYVHSPERLTSPLIRKEGSLVKASWEEALGAVASRFQALKAAHGADALAGLGSPRLANEELYLFQKFVRGVLGTNNIDHAGGYSYAANLALRESLGYAASTNSINEIRNADVILALRSDLSETHPVVKSEVVLAVKRRKAKLIVVNSRNIYLNKFSALNLRVKPGSEAALANGLMQVILTEDLAREDFLRANTEGLEELKRSLASYTAEKVEALTGVPAEDLAEAARLYAKAPKGVILISTGLASGKADAALAHAAADLALLTGQIGKEGAGVFLLGEKNNSQGALDMGATPGLLPGYADVTDPAERARFEQAWKLSISERRGMDALAMLQAAGKEIKGMYIAGENPAVTYPDAQRVRQALAALDFLVVQDCFLTETAALAHVVLPAATFAEKEGTFTSAERRVQRVRQALRPLGEARPDLWIFQEAAKAMGTALAPASAAAVMKEVRTLVPLYGGVEYARLDAVPDPAANGAVSSALQWPCPAADHAGTPVLYTEGFPRGKAKLIFAEAAQPAGEGRFVLITGPMLFHSGSLSLKSAGIAKLRGESFVEIDPADAAELGIVKGQPVTLVSAAGKITVKAVLSERAGRGVLFVPCHFAQGGATQLTSQDLGITRVTVEKN